MWPWFYTQIKGSERGLCSEGLWWLYEMLPLAIATLKIGDGDSGPSSVDFHSCSCRHLPMTHDPPSIRFHLYHHLLQSSLISSPPSSQSFITLHHAVGHLFLWLTLDIAEMGQS